MALSTLTGAGIIIHSRPQRHRGCVRPPLYTPRAQAVGKVARFQLMHLPVRVVLCDNDPARRASCGSSEIRYRRYYMTTKPDGSVRVISHGPLIAFGSSLRLPIALVLIGTAIAAMVQSQWSTGGLALIVGALLLPNYAKRRKAAAKNASKS